MKDAPIFKQLSAEERALIAEQEIVGVIDAKNFRFSAGFGWLRRFEAEQTTPYCGCVVGALALALSGGDIPFDKTKLEFIRPDILATGLVTSEELFALENGYEGNMDYMAEGGPFWEAGQRLRSRPDATPVGGKTNLRP